MKIGILSVASNFHTQKWARALARAGAEVVVFTYENSVGIESAKVIQVAPHLIKNHSIRYSYYWRSKKYLAQKIAEEKIDVLNPMLLTPFGSWAIWSGFKNIIPSALGEDVFGYRPVSEWNDEIRSRAFKNTVIKKSFVEDLKRIYFRGQVKRVCKNSPFIHADNLELKNGLMKWFHCPEERIEVFPYGLDETPFQVSMEEIKAFREKYKIPDDKIVILSPRGLKPVYQSDIIFDAFMKLLHANENVFCIMMSAGYKISPEIRGKYQKIKKLHSRFLFLEERLSEREMAKLWFNTDIFVSAPVFDGYSASVSEGRYCGCIPVVNDIPANREVLRDNYNGFIIENFSADTVVKKLSEIIPDYKSIKERMTRINREWILKNSLTQHGAEKMLNLCERLLSEKNYRKDARTQNLTAEKLLMSS